MNRKCVVYFTFRNPSVVSLTQVRLINEMEGPNLEVMWDGDSKTGEQTVVAVRWCNVCLFFSNKPSYHVGPQLIMLL